MRKQTLLGFVLFFSLAATFTLPNSLAQVGHESCQCFDQTRCCQTFVYTPAGWVPVTEPEWSWSYSCYSNPPILA